MAILLRRNRNFRLLFSASAVSNLGDGVSALAFPWLATLLTRDPLLIGLVAMAGRLPWFLFSLPAGVWTDRTDRRLLMIRANLVRLALTLMVVGLVLSLPALPPPSGTDLAAVLALAALAFFLGSAEVLHDNAAQTLMPSVVDHADLEAANGQMWSAEQVMGQFIGPPLAGLLIAAGILLPFGFDAATFALAAGFLWLMVIPPVALPAAAPFLAAFREGIRWMAANRVILRLAVMLGILNASYMACLTVMVLFAQEVLGLGAVGVGLMMTAGACGGVIGGLIAPAICRRLGLRGSMVAGLCGFGLAYLMFALTGSALVAGAALAIEALGAMVWNVATVSYRQRLIPAAILGRVNSIYRFFGWGSMPLGALGGGLIVSLAENDIGRETALRLPFALAAVVTVLLLAYALTRLRTD